MQNLGDSNDDSLRKSKWNRKQGDIGSTMEVEFCRTAAMRKAETKLEPFRYQETKMCMKD